MFDKKIVLGFVTLLTVSLTAAATEMPYGALVSDGFRQQARIAYVTPPKQAKVLPSTTTDTPAEAKQILDGLFDRNNTKALVVARGSEILYERYRFGVGKRSTPLGYSMSKSLTALAVGRAICDGHINSINDPIKRYVPRLAGTSWGEASVKDVLRMSSGAYKTELRFNGHKNQEQERSVGAAIAEGKMNTDFIELMKTNDEKQFPSGSAFNYSNFDTVALGLLVQAATKLSFSEYFEKAIWHDVGAESRGAWMINGNGQASTYQGFSARPHDWIRLGVMVLNELGNKDSCFGKFLTDATSHQIASIGPATSYGYQIWIGCHASETNFCFVGFGGQYLLFNVATNTVIYHHATTFSRVVWQTPQVMDALLPALAKAK